MDRYIDRHINTYGAGTVFSERREAALAEDARLEAKVAHPGDNSGANRWFLKLTPVQMLPLGGSICGRLTKNLPLGCLQGGGEDGSLLNCDT